MEKELVDNLTEYILTTELNSKSNYEIFNDWAQRHCVCIHDLNVAAWTIKLIDDLRKIKNTSLGVLLLQS